MRRLSWTVSHLVVVLALLGALWIRPARCQNVRDRNSSFIVPSGQDLSSEKNYTIGEIQRLQWNATYANITICLFQAVANSKCETVTRNSTNRGFILWKVNTTRELNVEPRFNLALYNSSGEEYIWSPAFFIYRGSSASSNNPSTTATNGVGSTRTTIPRPGVTGAFIVASSPGSRGLSRAAKIGLGVGIPLAFLLGCGLVVAALLALRQRRRKNKAQQSSSDQAYHPVWTGDNGEDQRSEQMTYTSSYTGMQAPVSTSTASTELPIKDPSELPTGPPPAEMS